VYGRIVYSDGASYIGHYKNYKRHGIGKYISPNDKVEDGQWVDDVFQRN